MLSIRSYVPQDADALGRLFYRAVHEGASSAYSEVELQAWCPATPSGAGWSARLARSECVVAEWDGELAGFMTLVHENALVDLAFVDPAHLRKGVAAALLAVLEGRAKCAGLKTLTTEASLLAEPMFAANGWIMLERQEVVRNGVRLRNCVMQRRLD